MDAPKDPPDHPPRISDSDLAQFHDDKKEREHRKWLWALITKASKWTGGLLLAVMALIDGLERMLHLLDKHK